ncbi:MAG: TRAP transporter large permease [Lachnospiraceae bacterium]|nr:TRAP transporter large permease [Lachnospiraceae bacterium]
MSAILFLSLAILLVINVPIAVCLALACAAALVYGGMGSNIIIIPQRMFTSMDSFPFMAVPFFMLAGGIMESGGMSKRLVNFAKQLVGFLPGGLGIITVVASGFFGALSGSNAATVAAIGGIMIPAMEKDGYPSDYACAISASAGTLGVVVPPSTPMITYAVVSGVSIGTMFIAGFIPALLMIISLSIVLSIMAKKYNFPLIRINRKDLWKSFKEAIFAIIMPVVILGGIYGGIFTPTESAAVAVLYSIIISMFVYREISLKDLKGIIIKAGRATAVVLFVIATSGAFSWLLVSQKIPDAIAAFVLGLSSNPVIIMLLLNIILLILGVFLETNAIILLITPMLLPIVSKIGVSYLEIGIILVVNTSVGMLTPPMALNILVASGIGNQTIEKIAKKVVPFLLVLILDIFIITFVPGFIEFLPKLMGLI